MPEIRDTLLDTILMNDVLELSKKQRALLTDEKMENYVHSYIEEHTYFSIKGTAYDYFQFVLKMARGGRNFISMELKRALCYKFKIYFKRLKGRNVIEKYNTHVYIKVKRDQNE